MSEHLDRPTLRFGDFELDPHEGELRRRGRRVRLAHQPFEVLHLLASRGGEVVTREEIQRHVWGEDTHVDFERGLNFCVLQIRRALGDDARTPRYLETVPRRGYRLIAAVERDASEVEAVSVHDEHAIRRNAAWPRVVLGVLALLALLLLAWEWTRGTPEPPLEERLHLAVLPFKNLSGDPAEDYFCEGMTEETIAQLGGLDPARLGVIARTTMERYRGTTPDLAELGRDLGVGYVLEGSVRRDDGQVRITAQLIVLEDLTHLWARSYQRNQWGALVVQREIGAAIAEALRIELLDPQSALPDRAGSHVPAAHDAYLAGRYLQHRHHAESDGANSLRASLERFREAIELDSSFALPHAAAAESWYHLALSGGARPHDAFPAAKEAAARALEISPDLAEAHLAAGRAAFWYDWDATAAEDHLRHAVALNPSFAEAHHELGWLLIAAGRTADGLAALERARLLDPLSPRIHLDTGWALIQARRYDDARRQCQRTLELEPEHDQAQFCLGWIDHLESRDSSSQATLRERLEALDAKYNVSSDDMTSDDTTSLVSPYSLAMLHAMLGEADSAFARLDEALTRRQPSMALLGSNPAFDDLRDDPRFSALLAEVGIR